MKPISVLHGPNLNLLGTREPEIYGATTLSEINSQLEARARKLDLAVVCAQSNHEGELVDAIQAARNNSAGIVINPAAFTHTSVAIRDAVAAVEPLIPIVEVHLSNPWGREEFRQTNLIKEVVSGRIEGFGVDGYLLALEAISGLIAARGKL